MRAFYSALLALGLCAVSPLTLAQSAWAQEEPTAHTIAMTGHGEAKAPPDAAELSAGVRVEAPTAKAALADADSRMEAVLGALRKMGVADKAIATSGFSVAPQYASGKNEAPRLTGYQVSNRVDVRLDDSAKLGAVLDALVAAGANDIGGVRFSFRDPTSLLTEARRKAVADARAKAETYAQAAGVALGPLVSLRESAAAPRPLFAEMRASVPVAPGEQSIAADVTLVWEIK